MIKQYDLSGIWSFILDEEKQGLEQKFYEAAPNDTIPLPGTTAQAGKGNENLEREIGCLTELYPMSGYAWFSREISVSPSDIGKTIKLFLERTRITRVWVDGVEAGGYDSLTTPHIFDLTDYVKKEKFRLDIMVSNVDYKTGGGHLTSQDTQTNWNGITGRISLDVYDDVYIEDIKVTADIAKKASVLELSFVNKTGQEQELTLDICAKELNSRGEEGKSMPAGSASVKVPAGNSTQTVTYTLGEEAKLWSEYSPVLYRLEVSIRGTGEVSKAYTGLREFTTDKHNFLINGTPTLLRGKHDGMIFPLTGAAPTDVEEWLRVMGISKEYGMNHYRYHTCCPPEAAFIAADLLGIYMEPQLPFWGTLAAPTDEYYNEEEESYLIEEGFRMLKAYGNHPSFCMMSLGNELWGSAERMGEIIRGYKAVDARHLYTQGSNNFQHFPLTIPEDDFFVGVRLMHGGRLFRGSYATCDAPIGHVQTDEPSTLHDYDEQILPGTVAEAAGDGGEEIEIQFGTGVKKVKAGDGGGGLMPEIPVVSHEIGQYAVYPNFREIEKYTGVLKARNFEVFRERLEEKGMADQADDFFYCSGKLSVQCYKEELEAAHRSRYIAGYQILDIQDFTGQGTALVGILDAFMDSKGHVTPKEWSGYCSDTVLLAKFPKYCWESGETFTAGLALSYFKQDVSLQGASLVWKAEMEGTVLGEGSVKVPDGAFGLVNLEGLSFPVPELSKAGKCHLTLQLTGTEAENSYDIWLYPAISDSIDMDSTVSVGEGEQQVQITASFAEAEKLLAEGKKVLFLPKEVKENIQGFYCTDFWCYPMFRSISESMEKEVPVGTMGLLIQDKHPALAGFPTEKYSTPQWYSLVSNGDIAVLDDVTPKTYRPIVQMIDNFERNHKLGLLFEAKVGAGRLMVCTSRLSEQMDRPEVKQFAQSILTYMLSDGFAPKDELSMQQLVKVFG